MTTSEPQRDEVERKLVQAIRIDGRYWLLMIVATTFGEIFGNLISRDLGLGYELGSTLLISLFVALLSLAVAFRSQNEKLYWALILAGNVAGTDVDDRQLHLQARGLEPRQPIDERGARPALRRPLRGCTSHDAACKP